MALTNADGLQPCGLQHTAALKKKVAHDVRYALYSAAAEGCCACVRYYVEVLHVDAHTRSDTQGYTPRDWAVYGTQKLGHDVGMVLRYLDGCPKGSEGPVPGTSSEGERSLSGLCSPDCHMPKNKSRRSLPNYCLYEAAYAGCLHCTKHWVEQAHVHPLAASASGGWTAVDWALHGADRAIRDGALDVQQRCEEVARYLQNRTEVAELPSQSLSQLEALYPKACAMLLAAAARSTCSVINRSEATVTSLRGAAQGLVVGDHVSALHDRPGPVNAHRVGVRRPGDSRGLGYMGGDATGRGQPVGSLS